MSEIIKQQDSRRVFIDALIELARHDDKILLIICDVGFNYCEKFQNEFPNQFLNLGVTEQSSVIISAALALSGFKPYFYSMINFVAFRPFEMVRNAVHCHNANVKLIGVKGSEKYKFLGFSHNMIIEDEDVYHLKPYMDVFWPKNNDEVRAIIETTYRDNKAAYIRL